MRRIGDEVLAGRLQSHLPRHVPDQQQGLPRAVGHHLERQIEFGMHRWAYHQRRREIVSMQVAYEFRGTDEIVHPQSDIDRPLQSQQSRRLAIEPDDLVLAAQDDDAVGQRRGGSAQLAV